jgi:hypothetical protein
MLREFQRGARELAEIWAIALKPETLAEIQRAAQPLAPDGTFHLDDRLWARVILEFSWAYRTNRLARSQILASLAPLYLGRVASFVGETRMMGSPEVEGRIEDLCRAFEEHKPYLAALWQPGAANRDSLEVNNV